MRKSALALVGAVAVLAAAPPQKTAWGDPDLQGIWAQKYQIPLRPARDAGRTTLTAEEVKHLTGAYDIMFEADPIDTGASRRSRRPCRRGCARCAADVNRARG